MLAEAGDGGVGELGHGTELRGEAGDSTRADFEVVHLDDPFARGEVWVRHLVEDVHYGTGRDASGLECVHRFRRAALARPPGDDLVELVLAPQPRGGRRVARVVGQLVASNDFAERTPHSVTLHLDGDPEVIPGAWVHIVRRHVVVTIAHARAFATVHREIEYGLRDHGRDGFPHGHFDVLAFACRLAVVERGENTEHHHRADSIVRPRAAEVARRATRVAADRRQARVGADVRPPTGRHSLRTSDAEGRTRNHDDARVHFAKRFVAKPQLVDHARGVVLGNDVCPANEFECKLMATRRRDIEGDALLAVVQPVEGGAAVRPEDAIGGATRADGVEALVRFHADDLRAKRAQPGSAMGHGEDPAEVDDANPLQGRVLGDRGQCTGLVRSFILRPFDRLTAQRERFGVIEQLGIVLAEQRCRAAQLPRRGRITDRSAGLTDNPCHRVLLYRDRSARDVLGRHRHFAHRIHGEAGDASRLQHRVQILARVSREPFAEPGVERVRVRAPAGGRGEGFALGPFRAAHDVLERLPPVIAEHRDRNVAVRAGEDPGRGGLAAVRRDCTFVVRMEGERRAHHVRDRLQARYVNDLSAPIRLAIEDSRHGCGGGRPAREVLRLVASSPQGRLVFGVRDGVEGRAMARPAHVPGDEVPAPEVAVWPGEPEGSDRRPDQARIVSRERAVVEPRRFELGRRHVANEDIRATKESVERRATLIRAEVQRDAALVGVKVEELATLLDMRHVAGKRPACSRRVAAGRFDFYHISSVVGHRLGREGARKPTSTFDDNESSECSLGHGSPQSVATNRSSHAGRSMAEMG